ncbi:hypothetical protein Mapa_003395 [Marchantia paleacea]|nr:hypothetical protein Mapa_003395 [Marchantia paleacea]
MHSVATRSHGQSGRRIHPDPDDLVSNRLSRELPTRGAVESYESVARVLTAECVQGLIAGGTGTRVSSTAVRSVEESDAQRSCVRLQRQLGRPVVARISAPAVGDGLVGQARLRPLRAPSSPRPGRQIVLRPAVRKPVMSPRPAVEEIHLLRRIVVVNVPTQIVPLQAVDAVLHAPQSASGVEGQADLVPQAVGEDDSVGEVVAAWRDSLEVERSHACSIGIRDMVLGSADAHVERPEGRRQSQSFVIASRQVPLDVSHNDLLGKCLTALASAVPPAPDGVVRRSVDVTAIDCDAVS